MPQFLTSARFFIAQDDFILDEWGIRLGRVHNLRDPASRSIEFFDERIFVQPQAPHDVHWSDGKTQRKIGVWRMEKGTVDAA